MRVRTRKPDFSGVQTKGHDAIGNSWHLPKHQDVSWNPRKERDPCKLSPPGHTPFTHTHLTVAPPPPPPHTQRARRIPLVSMALGLVSVGYVVREEVPDWCSLSLSVAGQQEQGEQHIKEQHNSVQSKQESHSLQTPLMSTKTGAQLIEQGVFKRDERKTKTKKVACISNVKTLNSLNFFSHWNYPASSQLSSPQVGLS